ncbi:MAG: fused MFS/spermidine synthase, partial [Planctomycetes bacterium]|nr:fused MFS/spermidine synthase [Planctomycetota bacterium]
RLRGRVLTGLPHHDEYAVLPMLLDRPPGSEMRMLMIGIACGIDVGQWRHFWGDLYRLRVTGAEIDPAILDLGRRHFGLPGPGTDWLEVHAVDGRHLLRALPAGDRFHAIVVDAFANELSVPFHLATLEFFGECRDRLEPGGLLAMNVNARDATSPNLLAIANTLATVFGSCLRVGSGEGGNYRLIAAAAHGAPDFSRLEETLLRARFGDRPGIPEWPDLLALAASMPDRARRIAPAPRERTLTDDHAPLEWLSDRFR